jgi:glycosyltransferase involved in cell wall biosynthesis
MTTSRNSKARKEILYLSYDGLTDTLGQSQILPYLRGLAKYALITVITFEKPDRFQKYGHDCQAICDEGNLRWIPMKYHKAPPLLSTVYDLFALRSAVKRLLSEKRFAAVHCRSYLTALIGLWAKRKFGLKFIFDMRGFWADERIDGGLWNLANPVSRLMYIFFKRKEKRFIREADHIIALTDNAKSEVESWKLGDTPISVIPTCVDMDHFKPQAITQSQTLRGKLLISPRDFVLIYLGSWGTWYLTQEMLDFFSVLDATSGGARLLILTPDQPDLSSFHLASKVIVRMIQRDEVPAYLAIGNAVICFIKPSFSKKASSATKIAEAWAMNLPVVTNNGWGDIEMLAQAGFPLITCDLRSDYKSIALQLLKRKMEDKTQMLMGRFDLHAGIQKYKRIYESLDAL